MSDAAKVRAVRERLDLTQEELAERMGVSSRTIKNYEAGHTMPKPALMALKVIELQAKQKAKRR